MEVAERWAATRDYEQEGHAGRADRRRDASVLMSAVDNEASLASHEVRSSLTSPDGAVSGRSGRVHALR